MLYIFRILIHFVIKKAIKTSRNFICANKEYVILLSSLALIICGIVGIVNIPNSIDPNQYQGPVVNRLPAKVISIHSDDHEGIYTVIFAGKGKEYYSPVDSEAAMSVYEVKVGDSVILNLNKDGYVLTFADSKNNLEYCSFSSDCDW